MFGAKDPHAHDVFVRTSNPGVLALPSLDYETRLLVRADGGDVRSDRLKVNPTEIVTDKPELDELDNRGRPDAA